MEAGTSVPTVALVHGAFADGSSWNGIIASLRSNGVPVIAIANPLRGLAADAAYVAEVIREIPGPVVAVGHSYGGAVISDAAAEAPNVIGLVFVAAYATDEGEILGQVSAGSHDSVLGHALIPHHYGVPNGDRQTLEFTVNPALFQAAFAADLPAEQASVLAATQRPIAEAAFSDAARSAAWRRARSWAVIATADRAAGTDVTRSMAERAGATITEVEGSHVIMISRPDAVADVIKTAAAAVSRPVAATAG
jgi:pimeloyl-ACP methyl ester carboxylesterase